MEKKRTGRGAAGIRVWLKKRQCKSLTQDRHVLKKASGRTDGDDGNSDGGAWRTERERERADDNKSGCASFLCIITFVTIRSACLQCMP